MTRKSLALATIAGFAASAFVGVAPAQAEETLTLAPNAGTGYSTLSGSTFTLETGWPSSIPGTSIPALRYRVQNDSLGTLAAADMLAGATGGTEVIYEYGQSTSGIALSDNDFVVTPQAGVTAGNGTAAIGSTATLELSVAHTAAFSVVVTAWLDVNGNNTIDTGEASSPARTVTWIAASDATASVAMVAPLVGDDTLQANVSFSGDVNVRQIDSSDVLVQFGTVASDVFTEIGSFADNANGSGSVTKSTTVTSKTAVTANPEGNNLEWDAVNGVYKAVFTPIATAAGGSALSVAAGTVYGANLYLDNDDDDSVDVDDASDKEGSTATTTTEAAATNYSVKWNAVATTDVKTTQIGYEDAGSTSATGYTDDQGMTASVRATATASSAFTVSVFVGTDVTVPVGVEDVPVKMTVSTGSDITISDALEFEGLALYSNQDRNSTKSTNASGVATFAFSGGKVDDTDNLTFTLSVNGTAPGAGTDGTVTFSAADYSIYSTEDLGSEGGLSIAEGATFSSSYEVVDQWGQAPANGTYRVVANDNANAERTTAADFAVSVPVVDGLATVSVTDNGVGTGTTTMRAGHATIDGSVGSSAGDYVDTAVKVVADATPSSITLSALTYGTEQLEDANSDGDYSDAGDTDNRTKLVLETESIYTYISNTAAATETAPTPTANLWVDVAGTVKNAAGTAVPYAKVTMSAPKFLFNVDGSTNYVMDEITLIADSAGVFSVKVYSNSGGVNNIAISAGAATATQQLTYAGASAGAAADFTVTTPGASEPGRTVDVTVNVTDVNGNGVEGASLTLSSTGPGYLINTSGTSLSDGTFTTKLLLGANDSGTAVVKVAITIDGSEVIKTSSISVGEGAVAAADKKVNAGSFKGYVAVYAKGYAGQRMSAKIGNDWVIVPSLASNFERVTDFTGAGVDIAVRIYIDRVLMDTINLTTK